MPEKTFPTISDRKFPCGGCPKEIQIGDPIIFMLPSKRRYCEDCGNRVYTKQIAAPKTATTGPMAPADAELLKQLNAILARLDKLESEPRPEQTIHDAAILVSMKDTDETIARIAARLTTLENQFKHTIGAKISP
jgi:hypothetical protein